ncbi:MAG: 4-phosphoerythronate dehydrogenase [Candidatus Hydrogenedentes bacterium]|nr:4-phosphoerythronate dehydrogenase [Candidatus Hydrogenedentota bacterium]
MQILADENIPYVREAFSRLGDVQTISGRAIAPSDLAGVDVLLVRSVTQVDAALLTDTALRFVGSATSGVDHVDITLLDERGIAFSYAPGSNANSVAEYVVAALLVLEDRLGGLDGKSMGIVGGGHVGSRVRTTAKALGLRCIVHDPPLEEQGAPGPFATRQELLDCDIVTLHVPLTHSGPHPTHHLVDEDFLGQMRTGALLINTSRGAVVDGVALGRALESGQLVVAVLDVWESEPDIDFDLLQRVSIGTPHIAGYSWDGKVNGTRQLYEALCRFLGTEPGWTPPQDDESVPGDAPGAPNDFVREMYDIMRDDADLRVVTDLPDAERASAFDRLRKEYRVRREFRTREIRVAEKDRV